MNDIKNTKLRKPLRIAMISIAAILVLVIVAVFVLWHMSGRPSLHRIDASQMRTMDFSNVEMYPPSFATDALYLVQLVENTHPIFVIDDWLPSDYEVIRDEFLAYTHENIERLDFTFAMLRYITALRDAHMNILGAVTTAYVDIHWQALDDRLFLLDDNSDVSAIEVVEIGGIPVGEIFATIERYYYSENEFGRENSRNRFSRAKEIIERSGGNTDGDIVKLVLDDNGVISIKHVELNERKFHDPKFIIRHEMIDDVFTLDIRTFINVPSEVTQEAVQAIEDAVAIHVRTLCHIQTFGFFFRITNGFVLM